MMVGMDIIHTFAGRKEGEGSKTNSNYKHMKKVNTSESSVQAAMPKTLARFDQHQERYYKQLQKLPYFNMVSVVIEEYIRQIVDKGAFCLRVQTDVLESILKDGRLRNKLELSDDVYKGQNKETRKEVTRILFGQDPETLQPWEFHKYGYLTSPDMHRELILNYSLIFQYGSVVMTLRKERMMHRTTLCFGDSLNFGACSHLIPTRTDRIRATCIPGLKHAENALFRMDGIGLYLYIAEKILSNALTVDNFINIEQITEDAPPVFQFIELHYHGLIDLKRDIERMDATVEREEDRAILERVKPQFEALGIPFKIW